MDAIPGPDPGACPTCGDWVKAGIPHECVEPVTPDWPGAWPGAGKDERDFSAETP